MSAYAKPTHLIFGTVKNIANTNVSLRNHQKNLTNNWKRAVHFLHFSTKMQTIFLQTKLGLYFDKLRRSQSVIQVFNQTVSTRTKPYMILINKLFFYLRTPIFCRGFVNQILQKQPGPEFFKSLDCLFAVLSLFVKLFFSNEFFYDSLCHYKILTVLRKDSEAIFYMSFCETVWEKWFYENIRSSKI